jgi:hypothetical protein
MVHLDPLDRLGILGLLGEYQERLSPQMLRAGDCHRFPVRLMRAVSR